MPEIYSISLGVAGLIIGLVAGWLIVKRIGNRKIKESEHQAHRIIDDAEKEAQMLKKETILEAKDELYKAKSDFEREMQNKKAEFSRMEKHLSEREENLDRKVDVLNKKERDVKNREKTIVAREKALAARDAELDKALSEQNKQLERVAGMSAEEAKQLLLSNLESEARQKAAQLIKDIREEAERNAEKEARNIIIQAIQRCAADHATESTVSVVNLPSDEMKGRIIGREGRNIRSFEIATGVDVIVDDTPEAVILSGYDPIRREVARMALERLVTDGRIHPARIEEVVQKCDKEMEIIIRELGEQACFDCGVHGLHSDVVRLLGKLNFRTSYGQNVLQHAKEVSFLCGIMASELSLDPVLARRAGLLHDIGKAVDRDTEGTHTQIGVKIISKYNENPVIKNAIESHHEDVIQETPYSVLVQAADAISGARPGARRETLEGYIKRLEKLEELADSFKGVEKAYAIQAGREVRVMVEAGDVNDALAEQLASQIAQKIQAELEYPGQIKVTVIRETRSVDYAR
ncbi:MAG: ribonuclease Y [candidate division Zixibacteria bacterium]|nr:ribonuclease Y [candidate division Zixibacteria bacterium]